MTSRANKKNKKKNNACPTQMVHPCLIILAMVQYLNNLWTFYQNVLIIIVTFHVPYIFDRLCSRCELTI